MLGEGKKATQLNVLQREMNPALGIKRTLKDTELLGLLNSSDLKVKEYGIFSLLPQQHATTPPETQIKLWSLSNILPVCVC